MPVRAVVFHPLAEREARAAYRWYARRSRRAALRFQQNVSTTVQRIASAPEQGASFRHIYRWMKVPRFPYLIYYEIRDPQSVLVYAIAHGRRRPGYWLRRP
jgi:plasmid stabilization system protein ParE